MANYNRRWFLKGTIALASVSIAMAGRKAAADSPTISVSTVEEFAAAIGSNRTIELEPGIYILSDIETYYESRFDNLEISREFDGTRIVISDVENLRIVGKGDVPARLLVLPRYDDLLTFRNCQNIEVENIEGGHWPQNGYCTGGVLAFENCSAIAVRDCVLFGSGTQGITLDGSSHFVCENTVIRDCTYHIVTIDSSRNVLFADCIFSYNREFTMVNVSDSQGVEFRQCDFSNNQSGFGYFFEIDNSDPVRVADSRIRYNIATNFVNNADLLELVDTELENNDFPD